MPTPLSLACETVDVPRHIYVGDAIGWRGVVYGEENRVLRLLNLAAEAILFVAWCCGKVMPSATPAASRS